MFILLRNWTVLRKVADLDLLCIFGSPLYWKAVIKFKVDAGSLFHSFSVGFFLDTVKLLMRVE